jgi:hypothetical protein
VSVGVFSWGGVIDDSAENMSYKDVDYEIEKQLQQLIGLPVTKIHRMAATGAIGFGDLRTAINKKGEIVQVPRYAIHISCSFRITDSRKNLTANLDMFNVNSTTEWTADFDWDVSGANLYDETAYVMSEQFGIDSALVVRVKANLYGDVDIYLSNGFIIQIFANDSSKQEIWRLFETESQNPHFAVTGQGIEE